MADANVQRQWDRLTGSIPPMPDFVRPLSGRPPRTQNNYQTQPPEPPQKRREPPNTPPPTAGGGILSKLSPSGIIKMLGLGKSGLDNDMIIILMLFLMMSGEGGDELLTLALIYIML